MNTIDYDRMVDDSQTRKIRPDPEFPSFDVLKVNAGKRKGAFYFEEGKVE